MPYIKMLDGWPVIYSDAYITDPDGNVSEAVPEDAIRITDAEADTVLSALSQGRSVTIVGGAVEVGDIPPPRAAEIRAVAARRIAQIGPQHDQTEINTWPQQVREVEQYRAGDTQAAIYLAERAAGRGITLEEMVAIVEAKRDAHARAAGAIHAAMDRFLAMADLPEDWDTNDAHWEPTT